MGVYETVDLGVTVIKKAHATAAQQEPFLIWTSFIPFGAVMVLLAFLPLII